MDYIPSQIELDKLDIQINNSTKMSKFIKKNNWKLLRVLFWLGNNMSQLNYSDEFIEHYIKVNYIRFKLSLNMWKLAHQILEKFKLEKRNS